MNTIRIFKHYLRVPFVLLGTVEILILLVSVYVAAYVRFDSDLNQLSKHGGSLLPRAFIFDSSGSEDPDGTITNYKFEAGDNS